MRKKINQYFNLERLRLDLHVHVLQSNIPATDRNFTTNMHVSTQEISIQTDDYDDGLQVVIANFVLFKNIDLFISFLFYLECLLSKSSVYCHIFSKFISCSLVYSIVKMILL